MVKGCYEVVLVTFMTINRELSLGLMM